MLLFEGLLSVVHMTNDGMSILEPLEITDTHVVVKVPHLSAFGLIWDLMKRFLNISVPIVGQVLLFLRPPHIGHPVLDVFLLQDNIPLNEVKLFVICFYHQSDSQLYNLTFLLTPLFHLVGRCDLITPSKLSTHFLYSRSKNGAK